MDHQEAQRKLSEYLDHALSDPECRTIEEHLAGCPSCRQALAELEQVVGAIRQLPPVAPPPWLTARIMARVREEAVPLPGLFQRLFYPLHIKIPLEALALLCLCVTGYYLATMTAPELAPLTTPPSPPPKILEQPVTQPPLTPEAVPRKIMPATKAPAPPTLPQTAPSAHISSTPESGATTPAAPSPPTPATMPASPLPSPTTPLETLPRQNRAPDTALSPSLQKLEHLPDIKGKRILRKELLMSGKDAAAPVPPRFVIRTGQPDRLEQELAETGKGLGVMVLRREETPSGRVVTIRLPASQFPALLSSLERFGTVSERPDLLSEESGGLLLTIRIEISP